MQNLLRHFPNHANLPSVERQRLRRYMLVILYTLMASSVVMVQLTVPINRAMGVFAFITVIVMLLLAHHDRLTLPSYGIPTVMLVVIAVFTTSGLHLFDPSMLGFLIAIMIAGLLLGVRAVWVYTGLSMLIVTAQFFLIQSGMIDAFLSEAVSLPRLTYVLAYIFIGGALLRLIISNLNRSLDAAHKNQTALAELNSQLEQRVAHRTAELEQARDLAEKLFQAGRRINAANSYVEVVDALVEYFPNPAYDIALSAYQHFDKSRATEYYLLAAKIAGEPRAQPLRMNLPLFDAFVMQFDEIYVEPALADVTDDPRATYLSVQGFASAMIVGLYAGARYIGNLSITTRSSHEFSAEEQRFLLSIADLTAAAVERIRLYDEQVETAEELRAVDRVKNQFLASVSHELRTPLNAIINFTKFVARGTMGPVNDEQRDTLHEVIDSGKHLLNLINDVLDMSRIGAGSLKLFVEPAVDLNDTLRAITASARTLIADKPIELRTEFADLPRIMGDRQRIYQILLNIVSNACKFTQEGHITIRAYSEDEYVFFAVEDTGPGIAPEDHSLVFEPFQQTETGLRQGGGTGLGMPISKSLVAAHGGRMWLESQPGAGATFYVALPIRSQDLEPSLIQ